MLQQALDLALLTVMFPFFFNIIALDAIDLLL